MAQRIAGVAFLKLDGIQFSLRGALTISSFSSTKAGISGLDGVHGYSETPRVPSIEAEISDMGGLSIAALQTLTNSTITAQLANGKVYILRNAWTAGEVENTAEDGKCKVKWEGVSMSEQVAP